MKKNKKSIQYKIRFVMASFLLLVLILKRQSGQDNTLNFLIAVVCIVITLVCLLFLNLIYKKRRSAGSFCYNPWLYDRKIVEIEGVVSKIIYPRLKDRISKYFINIFRNLVGDGNQAGRNLHLRFFIKSDSLVRGERLLVLYNLRFGQLNIKVGDKVIIKGQYIDSKRRRKDILSKMLYFSPFHYYGLLHYVHPPKGHVRIKDKK